MAYLERTKIVNGSNEVINPATQETLSAVNTKLPPLKENRLPVNAANITSKFREAFETYNTSTKWTEVKGTGDLIYLDGNSVGASYLVISKSPLNADTNSTIDSRFTFTMPYEVAIGLSLSQRTLGQQFSVEVIDTGTRLASVSDIEISAISQATTTLTVDTVTDHGLTVGSSIGIRGCSNPVANYPALTVASVPGPRQFTVTAGPGGTIASQTINNPSGDKGFVYVRERMSRAQNGISEVFEGATATQSALYIRSESGDVLPSGTVAGNHNITVGTTAPVALASSAYQYNWTPTTEYRIVAQTDRIQVSDVGVDAVAASSARISRTQIITNPDATYQLRLRAINHKSLTVPNAQIVSAVKTGTTTATITTDAAHGLVTGDVVVIYGIRDQSASAFPNLLTATAVTVVDSTSFTVAIGTAATVTSYGGYVAKVQGGNLMSALGGIAQAVQSATLSTLTDGTRQLVLVGSANWAGASIGDLVNIVGVRNIVDGASLGVDGAWKVANLATTSLTLVLPFSGSMSLPSDFASTNAGGGVIKRTDMRVSFVRIFDYERQRVEILARPGTDVAGSIPTAVTSLPTLATVTTVGTITAANLGIPLTVADVASAAITSSATVAAITPASGISYAVNINVTAVTGTNPTMDVSIEESNDSGTNWFKVYDFPRITATGSFSSPVIPLTGNRVRYVQTLGGTSPSFTRAINRLQSNRPSDAIRQLIDRSIVLTTLNSTTPSIRTADAGNRIQLVVNVGAITTTAPQLQLEGSDDEGASWYAIGTPLTAVASSTVQLTVTDINSQFTRARVSTAGSGVTAGYVMIKAHD